MAWNVTPHDDSPPPHAFRRLNAVVFDSAFAVALLGCALYIAEQTAGRLAPHALILSLVFLPLAFRRLAPIPRRPSDRRRPAHQYLSRLRRLLLRNLRHPAGRVHGRRRCSLGLAARRHPWRRVDRPARGDSHRRNQQRPGQPRRLARQLAPLRDAAPCSATTCARGAHTCPRSKHGTRCSAARLPPKSAAGSPAAARRGRPQRQRDGAVCGGRGSRGPARSCRAKTFDLIEETGRRPGRASPCPGTAPGQRRRRWPAAPPAEPRPARRPGGAGYGGHSAEGEVQVEVQVVGEKRPLPASVELSVYRSPRNPWPWCSRTSAA